MSLNWSRSAARARDRPRRPASARHVLGRSRRRGTPRGARPSRLAVLVHDLGVDDLVVGGAAGPAVAWPDADVPAALASRAAASYSFWLKLWLAAMSLSVADLMASRSEPVSAFFRSSSGPSTAARSSADTLSPCSRRTFSVWYTSESALLRTSASSRRWRSSSAWASASRTMRLMSSLFERRLTGDGHRLLLARGPVLGRHVHDAVGVDVEGDLDLRHAAGGRAAGRRAGTCPASCCTSPSPARPAARGSPPTAACPRRW